MAMYNKKRAEFLDASIGETHDIRVLFEALKRVVATEEDIDVAIQAAWDGMRVDAELQAAFDKQAFAEAQAREKAVKSDKKQGELEGQLKLKLNDDGTAAEAASDVAVFNVHSAIEEIEATQTSLNVSDATVGDFFIAAGHDGALTPEEQPEVYKKVLDWLQNIYAYHSDLSSAAAKAQKCSPELLVAVRVFLEKQDDISAQSILVHHFKEVLQSEAPEFDAGGVLFYCRETDSNQPDANIEPETIESYARTMLAGIKEKTTAPEASLVVLPVAPPELPWEDLGISDSEHEKILGHFCDGEPALGIVVLDGLIGAQFAKHSKEVQGLILEKHIARFETLADRAVSERKQAEEPQNDLEKAAAKKKSRVKK